MASADLAIVSCSDTLDSSAREDDALSEVPELGEQPHERKAERDQEYRQTEGLERALCPEGAPQLRESAKEQTGLPAVRQNPEELPRPWHDHRAEELREDHQGDRGEPRIEKRF